MKKNYCFFLLLAFIMSFSYPTKGNNIEIVQYDLDNGLHVILHQDNSTPIIAINIMYHVGSKNENPDRTGFAHFFEHLMFEGSPNIARGQYFKFVQNAGGDNNAFTSFDYTDYYEALPSNQLELGLWLESERLMHLRIDSIGVETQRSVVKEERKARYENQPYGSFIEQIFSNAYKVSPYRWVPIGNVQYIDQATIDEFRSFHNKYYVPGNAVLVIAGDINLENSKILVQKYFGDIPRYKEKIVRPDAIEPEQTMEVRKTIYDNIQLPAVFEAYHMPASGTNDYYALQMLQNLLSEGQSSLLYKKLVDEKQLALEVASFPFALENSGIFIILAIANMGKTPDEIEKALQEEINNAQKSLIEDRVFQKLRNQTETSFYSQKATVAGIAQSLATYFTLYKDANLINTEIDRYMKVTREDIQRVAQKYLTPENRVVLYYLPKQKEVK
jgi:zinc protease